jgi:hypothetical protein
VAQVSRRPLPKQDGRIPQQLAEASHDRDRKDRGETGSTSSDGKLIRDVQLDANETRAIAHGLGRKLVGWRAERIRANAGLTRHVPRETASDGRTVTLANDAGARITFHLWVY